MRASLQNLIAATERYLHAQRTQAFRPGPRSFSGTKRAEIDLRYTLADAKAELRKRTS